MLFVSKMYFKITFAHNTSVRTFSSIYLHIKSYSHFFVALSLTIWSFSIDIQYQQTISYKNPWPTKSMDFHKKSGKVKLSTLQNQLIFIAVIIILVFIITVIIIFVFIIIIVPIFIVTTTSSPIIISLCI